MKRPPFWFRLLLGILQPDFRREHGAEICELAAQYARARSFVGRTAVWLRASADLIAVAIRSRIHDRGSGRYAGRRADWQGADPGRFEGLARDVRHGIRSLRRDAAFTTFAILIVGLGIGASVTVFSVVHALLLRPLPFAEPDRLVWVSNGDFGRGQQLSSISVQVGHVVNLRNDATQLADIAGYHLFDRDGDHTLLSGGQPYRVTRLRVTENLFSVLGMEPARGRFFTAEEAWDDGPPAVVLTHRSWMRHFGGDPAVVGTAIVLDDAPATVVGVLPESFDFTSIFAPGQVIDYLAPFPLSPRSHRNGNTLGLIGRLASGATLASARAEIAAFAVTEEETAGRENSFNPVIRPLREHVSGGFRPAMALLVGAVTLVMLIVCANLSNLLLARGAGRERELAIRAALGAGRRRLVRQLLTESVLLSVSGAGLGIFIAFQGTRLLATMDLRIPLLAQVRVDGAALGLAVIAALGVGLLFGVAPALRGARVPLNETLKDGARGASSGRGRATLRSALVVSQIAIAGLLLVASTLTARSMLRLLATDLGYDVDRSVAMRIDPSLRFESDEGRLAFYSQVLRRVEGAPGITAAGLSDMLPMAFNRRWDSRSPDGEPEVRVSPYVRVISDGYLDAMRLSLLAGRDFTVADGPDVPRVALVNEVLANHLWGDRDPLGLTVRSSGGDYRVVGVVRATRQLSVDQAPGPELFFALRQVDEQRSVYLILRGDRPLEELVATARSEIAAIDPSLPLDRVARLRDIVDASVAPRRFLATILTLFAGFALVLAALGIYAVISYSVAQRRHEIGIHIALGATSLEVQRRLTRETVVLTGLGLGIGLVAASGVGRVLEGYLYGITALDPLTYAGVTTVLGMVALAAGWAPARSASRLNPLHALSGDSGSA